jgi:formylglycine-generating enzyme required for sulfatase activity
MKVRFLILVALLGLQVCVKAQIPEIEMVFVKGGTFIMGCTPEQKSCDETAKPAHQVTVDDFYIGKYEVTQAQWIAVMGSNPSEFKGDIKPVDNINWDDVQKFIRKLNSITGMKYRLPTDAEWEYAARGGTQSKGYRYSGSDKLDEVAWYGKDSGRGTKNVGTKNVGTKKANELDIHDMSGNVMEWTNDWYSDYTDAPQNNPKGPETGKYHIHRGGDWGNKSEFQAIVTRFRCDFTNRFSLFGVRLALSKK